MHRRVNNNDYVLTTSIGPHELLYIKSRHHEGFCVIEQCRRPAGASPAQAGYKITYRLKRPLGTADLFSQSIDQLSKFGSTETFVLSDRIITRVQLGPQHAVKWAAFNVDGAIFFAPYTAGEPHSSDILLKTKRPKRKGRISIEVPTLLLDADMSGINEEVMK